LWFGYAISRCGCCGQGVVEAAPVEAPELLESSMIDSERGVSVGASSAAQGPAARRTNAIEVAGQEMQRPRDSEPGVQERLLFGKGEGRCDRRLVSPVLKLAQAGIDGVGTHGPPWRQRSHCGDLATATPGPDTGTVYPDCDDLVGPHRPSVGGCTIGA
jgi:hypothetical protein